jgi:hypothetical protein
MNTIVKNMALLLGMCVALVMTGCELGGGGGGGGDDAPAVDVSGHWKGVTDGGNSINMNLIQSNSGVSGTTTAGGETGNIAGKVSGNQLSFTIVWPGSGDKTTGEATVVGDTMTGSFSGHDGSGTFTAHR